MTLLIHQFACLKDNYGFLIRDKASGEVACVDTPDADAILNELDQLGWSLSHILNTHWHSDHSGGNERLHSETGARIMAPAEVERVSVVDHVVCGGDSIWLGETRLLVMDTGGHTRQHVSYYSSRDGVAFVGDTLFALGCGRLFEGTASQMWESLSRIAALPDDTVIYCAHEYTAENANFAVTIDPSPAILSRAQEVFGQRGLGLPTVPTTIGIEKATNPFLRAPSLYPGVTEAEAFAIVRAAKDRFHA